MTAARSRRLLSMDLLDDGEHARLDRWGNRAALTAPATGGSIPVLFSVQVLRAPDAVALVCGRHSWTYRELDEDANRLAHLLAGQGVGPGERGALLLERWGRGGDGNRRLGDPRSVAGPERSRMSPERRQGRSRAGAVCRATPDTLERVGPRHSDSTYMGYQAVALLLRVHVVSV